MLKAGSERVDAGQYPTNVYEKDLDMTLNFHLNFILPFDIVRDVNIYVFLHKRR